MSTISEIINTSQWETHLGSLPESTLLIASFHAPWAAPCAQMKTVLDTLAAEYPVTHPLATSWISINAEEFSDISEKYNVTAVPYLVLIRNGQIVDCVSGSSAPKVRAAIESQTTPPPANTDPNIDSVRVASGTRDASKAPSDINTDKRRAPFDHEDKKDVFNRLTNLVKAAPVMLFMKGTPSAPQCGFSRQVVSILRERAVKYGFFNILADDEVRQSLKEFAEWPTYPQLWVEGELIGGLDIIKEEIENDPDFLKSYSVGSSGDAAVSS